jgi:hypothetical protein
MGWLSTQHFGSEGPTAYEASPNAVVLVDSYETPARDEARPCPERCRRVRNRRQKRA